MNIIDILENALVGKKILSHEQDKSFRQIITIQSIDEVENGIMKVTAVMHPLNARMSDPFYSYPITLDKWRFEIIKDEL